MALEGTLSDFSLPDIFQLISLQRKSGILTLKSPTDIVQIFFKDGNILAADSEQEKIEDRLGYYLLRGKLISDDQLRRALELQRATLQRIGNILITQKMVDKEVLQKTLKLVITQKIYKLFKWRNGEYHFDPDAPVDFEEDYFESIPAQGVLMEAVRMTDEWPMLERVIHSFDIIFRKTNKRLDPDKIAGKNLTAADLFDDADDFRGVMDEGELEGELEEEDVRVYRFVNGIRTVKDTYLDAQITDFDACHALVSLYENGYIEPLERFIVDEKAEWVQSHKFMPQKAKGFFSYLFPVMIILILLSLYMMNRLNFNILKPLNISENQRITELKFTASYNKLLILKRAVIYYSYIAGKYPENLQAIADTGLISGSLLNDPWGKPYLYTLQQDAFILQGKDEQGYPVKTLSIIEKIASH